MESESVWKLYLVASTCFFVHDHVFVGIFSKTVIFKPSSKRIITAKFGVSSLSKALYKRHVYTFTHLVRRSAFLLSKNLPLPIPCQTKISPQTSSNKVASANLTLAVFGILSWLKVKAHLNFPRSPCITYFVYWSPIAHCLLCQIWITTHVEVTFVLREFLKRSGIIIRPHSTAKENFNNLHLNPMELYCIAVNSLD